MYVLYVLLFGQTWQIGSSIKVLYDHPVELVHTVTTFKYVEGGPDHGPGASIKYQFVYLNLVTVCLNDLDSVCLNGRAGQGKPSRR